MIILQFQVNIVLSSPQPGLAVKPSLISPLPGSTVSIEAVFSNTGSGSGFRPVLELVLPVNTSFAGAEFLGYNITPDAVYRIPPSGELSYRYPGSSVERTVRGQPNATVVLLRPVLNNVQANMSLPPLVVRVHVSENATIGLRHVVNITPVFLYGSDPLDNPSTDPPVEGDTVHVTIIPQPLILHKQLTSEGWSDEKIPTGPNYWYVVELRVELAPRTFTSVNLTDTLPPEVRFVNITEVEVVSKGLAADYAIRSKPSNASTGGLIWLYVPRITGGPNSTIRLRYKVFIPYNYTGGGAVITPAKQDKVLTNRAFVNATYNGGYAQAAVSYNVTATVDVLYKSASLYRDNYAPGLSHWDIVKYRVTFYLSDFFNISSLYFRDTLGDGQRVLRNMTPVFWVKNGSQVLSGHFQPGEYVYHVDHGYTGNSTLLEFNLTKALLRVAGNDTVRGGLVGENWVFNPGNFTEPFGRGRTWGYIEFYALVEKEYNGSVPGDRIIDARDSVTDHAEFLHLVDGYGRTTSASAGLTVAPLRIEKRITHINGVAVSGAQPYQVKPGDNVTFELIVTIPTGNTEQLLLRDYLPIPVFNVTYDRYGQTPFYNSEPNVTAVPPPPGHWSIAPDDTVYSLLGIAPKLVVDAQANALMFNYSPSIHLDNVSSLRIHIYYTLTFTDQQYGDLLDLANLAEVEYRNSVQSISVLHGKTVVETEEPVLTIDERVNWTSGYGAITGSGDLENADAGDRVRFLINVSNAGHFNAYNVSLTDLVQPQGTVYLENLSGLTVRLCSGPAPAGSYRVSIGPNASKPLWLNVSFDGPLAPGDCILVAYNVSINNRVTPLLLIGSAATLAHYSSLPNGENFVNPESPPSDDAWLNVSAPQLAKTLGSSSESFTPGDYLAIGENASFQIRVTLPEGRVGNLTLVDALPRGFSFNGSFAVNATGFGGELPTPVVENYTSSGVNYVKIRFPGWLNVTGDNDPGNNAFTVTLTARAANLFGVNEPRTGVEAKRNTVSMDFDSNPGQPLASSHTVYLVEPMPRITSTLDPSEVDANDTVTVTIKVKNAGLADAFDVYVWDRLDPLFFNLSTVSELYTPPGFTYHYDGSRGLVWYTGYRVGNQSAWYTFKFTVRVRGDVNASQSASSTAYVNFTSLPGVRSYERVRESSHTAGIAVSGVELAKTYYNSTNPYTGDSRLAVGEEVTFRITVKVPEGETANLTVRDYIPPGLMYLAYQVDSSSLNGELPSAQVQAPGGGGGILNITFPGWTRVVGDNEPGNNYFYIYVRLRVLNSTENRGYPTLQEKTNRVNAVYATGSAPPAADEVYVAEPRLSVEKSFNVTVADGGDWVKFTVKVSNTGLAPAFDLNVSDTVDGSVFDLNSFTPITVQRGFLYSYDSSTGTIRFFPDNARYSDSVLNTSGTFTFEFALKVRENAAGLSTYRNRVYVNATSMPGRAAEERLYGATSVATLRIGETVLSKVLVNSSEAFTVGDSLAVGEVAWFNLTFTVPEGRMLNVTVKDLLPTQGSDALMGHVGRAYVTVNRANVASNKVALTPGSWTEIEGRMEGAGLLVFELGNITNSNNDAEPEKITICFAVLVYNKQGNQRGRALRNTFYVEYVNASGSLAETPSANYTVKVVEPELWSILTANPITVGDAGDVVVFQYNVTNRGDLPYVAPAFDLSVFGRLPPELANISVVSIEASGAVNVTDHSTGDALNITLGRLDPGGWVNVTFKAVLKPTAVFGQKITVTVYANGTSLPGRYGHQTFSTCQPGAACGERTGTGAPPNDIRTGDSISIKVGVPNIQKKVLAPPPFAVGDEVPYLIIIGTPKGRTDALIINDTLSQGLAYVNGSLRVRLPANVAAGNPPSNSSPFFTHGGGVLVFNFSSFQNNNRHSVDTNITFTAVVEDSPVVVRGRELNNTALLRYKSDNGSYVNIGPARVRVVVGEPELENLAAATLTGRFKGGDTVSFRIEFDNEGDTAAYDTLVVDNLPGLLTGAAPRVAISIGGRTLAATDYRAEFYANGTLKIFFLTPHRDSPARIMPHEHVTITIVATAVGHVPLSLTVVNNASVASYSSQPGRPAVERIYSGGQASSTAETVEPLVAKTVSTSWTPPPDPHDRTRARAVVGEPVRYNVTFAMPEGTLAYGVNFTDALPDGFKAFNATAYIYNGSGFYTRPVALVMDSGRYVAKASLGHLVDATVYIVVEGEVSYNYSSGTPVEAGDTLVNGNSTNRCLFEWSNGRERREAAANKASIEVLYSEANLTVEKWFDPPSVFLGGNATFTIRLRNEGNGTAFNVSVVDTLGRSLETLGANVTPSSVEGQKLLWKLGRLNPGETWVVRVTVKTINCSDLSNTAVAYWKNPGELSAPATAAATAALDIIPELNVTKLVLDDPAETGEKVRFTILIRNPSCGRALNVNVSDHMPPHFTYVEGSTLLNGTHAADPLIEGSRLLWNTSLDIAPGEAYNVTYTALSHNTSYTGYSRAVIYLRDEHNVHLTYEARSIVHIQRPTVIVQLSIDPYRGQVNETFKATITLVNRGPAGSYFIYFRDRLPSCSEYIPGSTRINGSPYPDPVIRGGTLYWRTTYNVSPGGALLLSFKFRATCQGVHEDKATIEYYNAIHERLGEAGDSVLLNVLGPPAAPPSPPTQPSAPSNETPTPTPPPQPPQPPATPELSLLEEANTSTVTLNDVVEFTITVSNTGSAPALGLKVTNILPPCLSYIPGTARVSGRPSEPVVEGRRATWLIPQLPPGGSLTISFAARVTCSPDKGSLTSLVTAGGENATTTVRAAPPEVYVGKTAKTLENGSVLFTITLHSVNYAGPLTVKDHMPPGLRPGPLPLKGVARGGEITWRLSIGKGETLSISYVAESQGILCGDYRNTVEVVETGGRAEATVSAGCAAVRSGAAALALAIIPAAILGVLAGSKPVVYDYKSLKDAAETGALPGLLRYSDKIMVSPETLEKIQRDAWLMRILGAYNLLNKIVVAPRADEALIASLTAMGLDREPASAIAAALSNNVYRVILGERAAYVAAGYAGLSPVFTNLRGDGFE